MLRADEDALVCDMAETYGVLDLWGLSPVLAATLAAGLRDDSRIKMRISGSGMPLEPILLAAAVDRLGFIAWGITKDGQNGENRPPSVLAALTGGKEKRETVAFESAEDFDAAWAAITKRMRDGN